MKGRMIVFLLISFVLLFGGTVDASERLDYREGDYLVHLFEDGDGMKQTFPFQTSNQITASNTEIRLFINAREIDSTAYTIDYGNHTITMRKAPDSGAEISMKYAIAPTFEWEEGVSGKASIGNALTGGTAPRERSKCHPVIYSTRAKMSVCILMVINLVLQSLRLTMRISPSRYQRNGRHQADSRKFIFTSQKHRYLQLDHPAK
ncbi:hypothetical protein [Paenibacillus alvei]|nr:hypothetical protein [Paenibacillus alvei]